MVAISSINEKCDYAYDSPTEPYPDSAIFCAQGRKYCLNSKFAPITCVSFDDGDIFNELIKGKNSITSECLMLEETGASMC